MNTAIIRLTFILLLGICSGYYLEWSLKLSFFALLSLFLIFLLTYIRARSLLFPDEIFGSSVFLLFFGLGIFVSTIHLPQNQPRHYINLISPEEIPLLKISIKESLKPDLYNNKFVAEVKAVNGGASHGKLLLLISKDRLQKPFLAGEKIVVGAQSLPLPQPLNPHQFDYGAFMAKKGIVRQIHLQDGTYIKLPTQDHGLQTQAAKIRSDITHSLRRHNFGKEELAIVEALLLGQKQDISPETYNNFAAAGAIHILAVSGLHVGIILMLLHWLFKPLKRLEKGKILKTSLIVLCLWGFALLAGLSPSVVRAVTMFSFIAVGMEINRRTSTLNSIFLSLLLLLLINPQWIFEVGFQLSYLAVLSIVLFQPLFSNLYSPSNKVLKYLWDLMTVSIAAQLGILPLSLYYFHQFPGLFFLSNLIILPFLGAILFLGILLIVLAQLNFLTSIIASIYESIIGILIKTVEWIAGREKFLFKDISFTQMELWGWYLFIILLFLLFKNLRYQKVFAVMLSVIFLQSIYIYQLAEQDEHLIVFHKARNSMIGIKDGNRLKLYHNLPEPVATNKMLQNYKIGKNLSVIEQSPLKNIYFQKDHLLIVPDSSGILPAGLPADSHLLLTGSPRINLERLLQQTKPSAIIADGSNYRTLVVRWKKTAGDNEILFHYTGEDGAYILK